MIQGYEHRDAKRPGSLATRFQATAAASTMARSRRAAGARETSLSRRARPVPRGSAPESGAAKVRGLCWLGCAAFSPVPSGLVENQKDMLVRADGCDEFIQIDLHGVGGDCRQNEREGVIRARLHGAVNIGEGVALITSPRRPLAPGEPAVTDAPFLANARFILEKETDFLVRMGLANLFQAFGEPPLKASCAASSFSGWRGRAFCREKPSRLMATDMDHG